MERYFANRWAELDQADQKWLPYHSNTPDDPHTCRFCKGITIDLRKNYMIRLGCDLEMVISAARAGCSLYQVFADIVVRGKHSTTYGHDARFSEYVALTFAYIFTAREETQVTTTSTLRLFVLGALDYGGEEVVGGAPSSPFLYCWTNESQCFTFHLYRTTD